MELPYIFVIDWDGTIAGKVDFQSQQFSLYKHLQKNGYKIKRTNPIPAAFYPGKKLIRPGLSYFMAKMKAMYGNVYFFIYTGSEKSWANQEIYWVEKTHNIKFERPIFVRNDCTVDTSGNIRKSITKIFPRILKAISKHHTAGLELSHSQKMEIMKHRIMIIDNNQVYNDNVNKLLVCPDYGYTVFENLLHGIPASAKNNPEIQKILFGYINQGILCPLSKDVDDPMKALSKQYQWLAAKCESITKLNEIYQHDDFWIHLSNILIKNNIRLFTDTIIEKLGKAVWKHAAKTNTAS